MPREIQTMTLAILIFSEGFEITTASMFHIMGLFCLLDLIMSWDINHVNCSNFDSSHWLNFSEFRLERIFQPMRALKFISGHMVYNLAYNQISQTKETMYNEILTLQTSFNQ